MVGEINKGRIMAVIYQCGVLVIVVELNNCWNGFLDE